MKKMSKKIISLLLAAMIVFGSVAVGVAEIDFAEIFTTKAEAATEYTDGYYTYIVTDGEATINRVDTAISGDVIVPSTLGGYSVTSIGDLAFYDCTNLTSIAFGENSQLTSIGYSAFEGCTSLTSIAFGENSQLTSIGDWAFCDCTNLTSIAFGENSQLTSIGDLAFNDCTNLTSIEIPASVTSIGDGAFEGCTSLTSIAFGENSQLTSIGDWAFQSCTSLTSIAFGENSQLTSIGGAAFYECASLTSIEIPASVTSIGGSAFSGCTSLTSIAFGENSQLTSIGDWAFQSCTSLTSIEIPNSVTDIGSYAFQSCTSLTSIEIPNSVTDIGSYAFQSCTSLTSIEIPNSVTGISGAFQSCTSLTSIEIPYGVTYINYETFEGCTSLTSISVASENAEYSSDEYGVLFNKDKTKLIKYPTANARTSYEIPGSVTIIDRYAFEDCEALKYIHIPPRVTSINGNMYGTTAYICSTTRDCYAKTYADENNIEFKVCTGHGDETEAPVTLTGIKVATPPAKTEYVVGDVLDTSGLLLTATFSDGTSAGVSSGYTCTPMTLNTVGTQIITVTYGGLTTAFEVEVIEKTDETTYTLKIDANGGAFSDGSSILTHTYKEGADVADILPPDREGYRFLGYTDVNGNSASVPSQMPANDVTLYASWEIIGEDPNPDGSYDVFYYVNGEIFAHYTAQPGMAVPVPGVSPAIDGLTFEGWTPAIASVMPENDLVYTAVFHGHSYEYTVVSQPDCTNHGTAVYTCSCGDTYTEIIPALGHDWGEWFVVIEATAAENGLRKRLCLRCAAEETEDIPAPEANFYVLDIADQEYSGYPIYPAVEAYSYGNARLDECFGDSPEESGYTVSYVNNTDAGVATAIITGVGEYYGVIRKNFNIVRKDISALDYADIPDVTDNGGEVTPDPVITDDGRVLVKDVDYIVEYENNGGAGQARIIVTGIGNYTGTLVIVFNIIENNTSITIPVIGTQVYTGGEIRPVFNLFSNGVVLVEGTDYTVEYADNINVGYGRIIITGLGNYSGTIVIIFRIVGTEITMTDIPVLPDAVYDRDYAPDFGTYPIIFNGRELVEGVDYDVIVRRNFSRGYYEIIIIGLGNFTGTITIYVNITGYDIAQSGITIGRIPDMLYEGEPVTPDITVYGSDTVLVENVDYIVEYRNNNSAGVATVIVKGIGAYRGTLTKTFVIYADNAYTLLIHTNKYELKYEQGVALKAEVAPVSERNLTVVWSSSNPSVATVNQDGFVTSCGEGDVIITATLVDEYGRAVIDPYGDEVSDSIVIKCTMTIWQKIIRFFRNLFSSIFSFNTVAAEAFKVR